MERNNESSLNRQRQRRQRNEYSENLIDPVTRQNVGDRLDYLNELQSYGRIDNTKDSRAVKEEIERLEEYQQQRTEQFEQAREEDRQRGGAGLDASSGPGGTLPTFEERERDAGLNLDGNDPMSGRGQSDPTMDEREAAAGLRGTTTGRDSSEQQERQTTGEDGELPDEKDNDDPLGTFGVMVVINNNVHGASIYGQVGQKIENLGS
tara:strand:+ start:1490 stop:2110 length:621 start_codon:yes stop_codon:yes gene_type:complete